MYIFTNNIQVLHMVLWKRKIQFDTLQELLLVTCNRLHHTFVEYAPDIFFYSNFSSLYLPGELMMMNETISEAGTPVRQIHLSPDGRMIIRMMASRGDLQLKVGSESRYRTGILHIYKAYAFQRQTP